MIYPKKEQFLKDSQHFSLIPVYTEMRADLETPISLFMKTGGRFLLESVQQGKQVGRYSFSASGEIARILLVGNKVTIRNRSGKTIEKITKNPMSIVNRFLAKLTAPFYDNLPPFWGGPIGYLGYEAVQYFEKIPVRKSENDLPDGMFIIPESTIIYDTVNRKMTLCITVIPGSNPEAAYKSGMAKLVKLKELIKKPLDEDLRTATFSLPETLNEKDITSEPDEETFKKMILSCKEDISRGEIIQAVLSRKFFIKSKVTPLEHYRALREMNPSPYMFFLHFEEEERDWHLIGSSPEVMVVLDEGKLLLKPIAGTRKRGQSEQEDELLKKELLDDEKEKAEHLMLIDLGRNDLGRVAKPGTVSVDEFMAVEMYSHVMHIVSTVTADLDEASDAFDVIRGVFPAGTLSGAPKVRAMEIIHDLEPERRGPYGGMVFHMDFQGNLDSCITIRTAVLRDGQAEIQAGAGIVYDSDPQKECDEVWIKAQAMLKTLSATGGTE